jgi:anthranilate phosphoribosyltransferase
MLALTFSCECGSSVSPARPIFFMKLLQELTARIQAGANLASDEARSAALLMTEAEVSALDKKEFLLALSQKGETPIEVAAFAATFRALAINPGVEAWADRAIDVCGTGGDGSGTFNISTAVSFIVAAAGVPVFKHGNRSITSNCGSADLMEALGIQLEVSHEVLQASLQELNFCFFFAPAFHPAFKEVMPIRQALAAQGSRTLFNLLGPLINPGRPAYQLLGVYASQWVQPLAHVLGSLGLQAGWVAHGSPESGAALDELSCAGSNLRSGFGLLAAEQGELPLAAAGLPVCALADLKGSDVAGNRQLMLALLSGSGAEVSVGLRNSVLLNAGAALYIVGRVGSLQAGVAEARRILDSGTVAQWLERVQAFYN